MKKMFANINEGFFTLASAVLSSKLFLDQRYIDFGSIPILEMLNGYDLIWLHSATIGLASIGMSFT
jgi:hypothetical protein